METHGGTVRVSIEIWDSCCDLCNIVYMQKAAAQQDAWAQRSVLDSADGKVNSLRWVSYLLLYLIFPLPVWSGKKINEPWKNSVAGAGPLGKSGPEGPGRDGWPGWDGDRGRAGPGGGGACAFLY